MTRDSREEGFLTAISDDPDDQAVRLIYADWLEERDDPRGELIRLEEEMCGLPIHGDRYWELKPRRNQLRKKCDEDWLEALRYGTDYQPVFRDVPAGVNGRWRLIREFIERWHGVPLGDIGNQNRRIRKIEKQVGYELPASVREWIALVGELLDGGGYDQVFRDALSFSDVEENPAFSLMIQGENDYHWAVQQEHLSLKDPPVDGYGLDYGASGNRFVYDRRWAPQVTTWALGHILVYLYVLGRGESYRASMAKPAALLQRLAEGFPVSAQQDDLHIFEATNVLAFVWPSSSFSGKPRLAIHLWKEIPPKEIPRCLRPYMRTRG